MSLHTLANHLQSAGRGDDKVLVHMTQGEVKGLQSLAMAHGGSLTINPETGLPEAGFLKAILPMVAGFFLGPAGIGLTAMQAGLTVGALGTAATGSLGKGFMMGLGAYGGAGLGAGLTNVGAEKLGSGLGEFGATAGKGTGADYAKFLADTGQTATSNMPVAATNVSGAGVNTLNNSFSGYQAQGPFAGTGINASNYTAQLSPQPSVLTSAENTLRSGLVNPPITTTVSPTDYAYDPISKAIGEGQIKAVNSPLGVGADVNAMSSHYAKPIQEAATYQTGTYTPPPSAMDKLGAGAKHGLSSFEGAKEVWNATPTGTGYGLAATGMSVLQSQQEEAAEEAKAKADAMAAARRGNVRPYDFSTEQDPSAYANTSTAESRYFVEPRFVARPIEKIAKDGGLMGYAVGGPVEQMSAENAIGGNMMYPQSQLKTDTYSNPMVQRPMPTNVIRSGIDAPVGTYTGEQRFASGGTATPNAPTSDVKYSYDPATVKYTQTAGSSPSGSNIGGGFGMGLIPQLLQQMKQSQPTQQSTIGSTYGGIAEPYMPSSGLAAANTAMVPNIQMQPQQDVNQQLGLEAFYPMMEQQLAMKGSNLQSQGYAEGGTANGGYSLGSYSDGGRLLKGPGDGVSDSIPASIGNRQPARLADGEFVVPARIVSEIGNGSTEAGARKLYAMMDRVQKARKKTVGKSKVAVNTRADKLLPA